MLDIAGQVGYDGLPTTDETELAAWFRTAAHSGSLVRYLEPFAHTVAVMQTPTHCTGWRRNACRTWPPTTWSTPKYGSHPNCTWTAVCHSTT